MKKISLMIIAAMAFLTLVACGGSKSPIVMSKIFDATEQSDNIIELYNPSDEDIDLKGYKLRFYTNDSATVSKEFALSGTIKANDYFAVGSSNRDEDEVKNKIDFLYEEGSLPYNGNDAIELVKGKTVIDFVGYKGFDINYVTDLTMIRLGNKEDYKPSATYEVFNFIYYNPDLFEYLKNDNHEIKTLEDIYAGPKLEERYKSMPYVSETNSNQGGGGAVVVTNTSISDGDTAWFAAMNGFPGGSVRYFYINTPEVNGSNVSAEPWGYVASLYNKQYLLSNPTTKEIRIQSIPGYSLTETYGRNIGFVWINDYLSQFLIMAEGLTEDVPSTYNNYDRQLTYKNVPYLTFLRFAEHRAKENGWATKGFPSNPDGEKSPDWNYTSNTLATTTPNWTPHLDLPWTN